MTLLWGRCANAVDHHRRCGAATTTQVRRSGAIDEPRRRASSSRHASPHTEQYCFGTATPLDVVVRARSLLPSPPAKTTAHVLPYLSSPRALVTGGLDADFIGRTVFPSSLC